MRREGGGGAWHPVEYFPRLAVNSEQNGKARFGYSFEWNLKQGFMFKDNKPKGASSESEDYVTKIVLDRRSKNKLDFEQDCIRECSRLRRTHYICLQSPI